MTGTTAEAKPHGRDKTCFFCLGAGNDAFTGIHSPRFGFNEDILLTGVETYCRAALDLLGEESQPSERDQGA